MTPIAPVPPVTGGAQASPVRPAGGFAESVAGALESVAGSELAADALVRDVAAGGDTPVHELMIAQTKASLATELLVQTRNRAVEAYQEIMRMQV